MHRGRWTLIESSSSFVALLITLVVNSSWPSRWTLVVLPSTQVKYRHRVCSSYRTVAPSDRIRLGLRSQQGGLLSCRLFLFHHQTISLAHSGLPCNCSSTRTRPMSWSAQLSTPSSHFTSRRRGRCCSCSTSSTRTSPTSPASTTTSFDSAIRPVDCQLEEFWNVIRHRTSQR